MIKTSFSKYINIFFTKSKKKVSRRKKLMGNDIYIYIMNDARVNMSERKRKHEKNFIIIFSSRVLPTRFLSIKRMGKERFFFLLNIMYVCSSTLANISFMYIYIIIFSQHFKRAAVRVKWEDFFMLKDVRS